MKQAIAALFLLLSFPVFMFGWGFLRSAVRLRTGQPFCAVPCGDYAVYGSIWAVVALLVLVPSAVVLLKRDSKGSWLVLPLLVLLVVAGAIPGNIPSGYRAHLAELVLERRMKSAGESLRMWSSPQRHLPENEGELQAALETRDPAEEEFPAASRFQRGGRPVSYRFVLMANAQGPHRAQPAGEQPALLYCAISPDRQRFWITATALPEDVTDSVVMLERDGQLVVVDGEVPPKPPEPTAAPAPGKKAGEK